MSKIKKICILSSGLAVGGAERFAINLATSITDQNIEVDLIIINKKKNSLKVNNKINVIDLNISRSRYAILKIINYVYTNKPNLFISTQNYLNIIAFFSSLFCKKTKFFFREANDPTKNHIYNNPFKNMIFFYLVKLTYTYADTLISPSKGVMLNLKKYYNLKRKIHVINNMVDKEKILIESNDNIDKYINLFNKPCIINIGRLEKQKNHELLINAFKDVLKNFNCNLIIIGDGSLKKNLQQQINDLKIDKNVYLLSKISNPYPFLKKSKVFVLTSDFEGFPNTILEALILGVKVISTNCESGPREILENGKYGILVETNNKDMLSSSIIQSLNNHENKKFIEEISNKYGKIKISKQYISLIE